MGSGDSLTGTAASACADKRNNKTYHVDLRRHLGCSGNNDRPRALRSSSLRVKCQRLTDWISSLIDVRCAQCLCRKGNDKAYHVDLRRHLGRVLAATARLGVWRHPAANV